MLEEKQTPLTSSSVTSCLCHVFLSLPATRKYIWNKEWYSKESSLGDSEIILEKRCKHLNKDTEWSNYSENLHIFFYTYHVMLKTGLLRLFDE